ncbi:hypothetical protein [Pelomonas sp. Root1217]|uniref:hypothetical protein n=1 Tax=Pelomonas sp. Root1217 TaxID=1736430 RepID=UPI0012F89C26|nr:hypothetical protein [Pelomonas sp. Root1217]
MQADSGTLGLSLHPQTLEAQEYTQAQYGQRTTQHESAESRSDSTTTPQAEHRQPIDKPIEAIAETFDPAGALW